MPRVGVASRRRPRTRQDTAGLSLRARGRVVWLVTAVHPWAPPARASLSAERSVEFTRYWLGTLRS